MMMITNDWLNAVGEEFNKPYYIQLDNFLKEEYNKQVVYPPAKDIFNAFHFTPLKDVKVVLLGHGPYHNENQAIGVSFAVPRNQMNIPASLQNIYKELQEDLGCYIPNNGYLKKWADQGVLLLNTVLTVRAHDAISHYGKGWEQFTDAVLQAVNAQDRPIVYFLWGRLAQEKAKMLNNPKHLILTASHPSPLSAYRGFLGCKHFSKANEFLLKNGIEPIDWQIENREEEQMAFIRVHELAKQYGLTNEQMMNYLLRNGIEVKNHMSTVDSEKYRKVISNLETRTNLNEHFNNTSLKMINIYGLFGEFDYKFDFVNDIFIWVSENGVGKTTILNLIVALLKGDKKTLTDINFKRIEVKIGNKDYIIDKSKMNKKTTNDRRVEELFEDLRRFLPFNQYSKFKNRYRKTGQINYEELDEIIHRVVYREFDGIRYEKRIFYLLEEVKELQFNDFTDELYKIKNAVNEEILFYPTYRRIEISLDKVFLDNTRHNTSELIQYIGFGMEDVKQCIDDLLVKMGKDANNSYVEMNSEILNELSMGLDINALTENVPLINKHKVEVVIKRIGEDRLENKEGLLAFVDGIKENPNEIFFNYYVSKLVKIYDSQKAIDDKLSKFADICTKYLSEKKVIYDEALLSMTVYNKKDKEIRWEDLSSGEKQIVSIFSKVYLDVATMSIFVIDEPEISLSIEWQKEFLKDIYNSGKVGLLIATTHSPFIFKNEFRDYTSEINLYRGDN